jgi:hypothetical protein
MPQVFGWAIYLKRDLTRFGVRITFFRGRRQNAEAIKFYDLETSDL